MASEIISAIIGGLFGIVGTLAAQQMKQRYAVRTQEKKERRAADVDAYEKIGSLLNDNVLRQLQALEAYTGYPDWVWKAVREIEYSFSDDVPIFHDASLEGKFRTMRASVLAFTEQSSKNCTLEHGLYRTVPSTYLGQDKQHFREEAVPVDAAARSVHTTAVEFLKAARATLRV